MAGRLSTKIVTLPITDGPQLNDQEFQGWYIQPGGTLEAINCGSGSSLFTTESYAECCAIGADDCTAFYTSCVGTASAVGAGTSSCSICQTMSIYDQFPINADPYTQILCIEPPNVWAASSIYRTVITSTITESVLTLTGASPSASSSQSGQASGGKSGSDSSSSSSSSDALIAGAIVGPVAALIIFVALLVWILRRRKRKQRQTNASIPPTSQHSPFSGPASLMSYSNQSYGNQSYGSPAYRDQPYESVAYKNRSCEVAGENQLHELPNRNQSHELHAGNTSPWNKPVELSNLR